MYIHRHVPPGNALQSLSISCVIDIRPRRCCHYIYCTLNVYYIFSCGQTNMLTLNVRFLPCSRLLCLFSCTPAYTVMKEDICQSLHQEDNRETLALFIYYELGRKKPGQIDGMTCVAAISAWWDCFSARVNANNFDFFLWLLRNAMKNCSIFRISIYFRPLLYHFTKILGFDHWFVTNYGTYTTVQKFGVSIYFIHPSIHPSIHPDRRIVWHWRLE